MVALVASSLKINIQGITIEKLFHFPHIWNTFAWIASWFNLLLGILAIMLVSNEFQFRTFRKQLIDGLSRSELLYSKVLVFILLAVYTMLLVFFSGFIFGVLKSPSFSLANFIEGLPYLPVLFIQSLGYMLMAMLFAFIIKNTALSIVSFILYFFPIEPIIRVFIPDAAIQYMPVKIIANLTPMPDFVGISLGDVIQIDGESGPGLYSMGIISEPMPLIYSSLIVTAYCLLFVFISKFLVRNKNF
ncbi:MAG: hypothetical protein CVT98_04695 [Bacteroidetes bacterium HGW-Bacteroidetes-15]|nr:MAG: hypothetical protein CVT98_04695 [Bacteroidetes bacterium HGW-Bacteroidetes-15]